MIPIKTETEIEAIKKAGKILAEVSEQLNHFIKEDIATQDIDRFAEELIRERGARPAFKGYRGFPANICISVNNEVVHGIPGERKINSGDIVSIDMGVEYEGFYADTAFTFPIGYIDAKVKKLIETTKQALALGIKQAKIDNHVSNISWAIQSYVETKGFSVVREFVGHGIGRQLHEEPQIPNFGRPHEGQVLREGMVLAIEPMVNMGNWKVRIEANGWTAVTEDGLPSCHFEHTVAVTKKGPYIVTKL